MKRLVYLSLMLISISVSALPAFREAPYPSWPCNTRDPKWAHFEEDCDTNGDGTYSPQEVCESNCRANEAWCRDKCAVNDAACHTNCSTISGNCLNSCRTGTP